MKFGLIGYPLGHSFSKNYFTDKFKDKEFSGNEYYNIEVQELVSIKAQISELKLDGFNVTIPHKQAIIQYLDHIEADAAEMNAVNVVKIVNNKWHGYNTDHLAFRDSISSEITPPLKALILGNGGAAKAVAYALKQMGITSVNVSRSINSLNYSSLNSAHIDEHLLIINTTPLGMFPHIDEAPEIKTNQSSSIPWLGVATVIQ